MPEVAKDLEAVKVEVRLQGARIDKLESTTYAIHELSTSVAVMCEQLKVANVNIADINESIESFKERPAEQLKNTLAIRQGIMISVASAVITLIISTYLAPLL